MIQYIDKAALVAKVNTIKENVNKLGAIGKVSTIVLCNEILSFLDTLEVKEVDLEKIVDDWYNTKASKEFENVLYSDIENCAKYFFELGLKAKEE